MSTDAAGWDAIRRTVLERDDYACRFCGTTDEEHHEEHGRGLHAHHIIPEHDGGRDDPENLITVCGSCHKTLEETHAKAVRELDRQAESELSTEVTNVLERREMDVGEAWVELLGGPFVPKFYRDDDGRGIFFADTGDLSPRERAAFLAGQVEANQLTVENLQAILRDGGETPRGRLTRPRWSQHTVACSSCKLQVLAHREKCPDCGELVDGAGGGTSEEGRGE